MTTFSEGLQALTPDQAKAAAKSSKAKEGSPDDVYMPGFSQKYLGLMTLILAIEDDLKNDRGWLREKRPESKVLERVASALIEISETDEMKKQFPGLSGLSDIPDLSDLQEFPNVPDDLSGIE